VPYYIKCMSQEPCSIGLSAGSPHSPNARGGMPAVKPCAWGSGRLARFFRRLAYPFIWAAVHSFAWLRIENTDVLKGLAGPVIFAANHRSHLDTWVLLTALPSSWRYRVATAVCDVCFADNRPIMRALKKLRYSLIVLLGNVFTLPRGAALRRILLHMNWLAKRNWSILIYPEGERSSTYELLPFEPGVGLIASGLHLPVVPVWIDGTHRVLPRSACMIRPGSVRVRFGKPLSLEGRDYRDLTRRVEEAIRALAN
jgi:1-acyl-sn-glycerol-3-phosphate acyltransferase